MSNFADNVNLNIDLTNEQEFGGNGGPPVPPGDYALTIVEFKQGQSASNQPVIKVQFEVNEPEEYAGKKLIQSYSLQAQALGRIKKLGLAVGAALTGIKSDDYLNQQLRATVVHRDMPAQAKPDGTMGTSRTMCNVVDERSYTAETTAAAAAPPITRGRPAATAAKPTNGATTVRRA